MNKGAAFEKTGRANEFAVRELGYPIAFRNNTYLPLRQWVQKNLVESVIDKWFLPPIEHDNQLVFLALKYLAINIVKLAFFLKRVQDRAFNFGKGQHMMDKFKKISLL